MSATLTTREAFLESILHDDHIILGRLMLPFCLEMWCILEALESPLITGAPITMPDLQLAVIACSTSSTRDFYRLTRRPSFWQRLWKAHTAISSPGEVLRQFNAYIDDYVPQFPRWETEMDGECKCPPIFICAAKLLASGQSDYAVSREIPLGKILSWGLAIDEGKGNPLDGIQSELEAEALKELERQEREIRELSKQAAKQAEAN